MYTPAMTPIRQVFARFLPSLCLNFLSICSSTIPMGRIVSSSTTDDRSTPRYQHVLVMRHGDRLDNFDESWVLTAPRSWDPPLVDAGHRRALDAGKKLRDEPGFPIHRIFVSPFLRCLQTSSGVVSGLSTSNGDDPDAMTNGSTQPSKVKVSIELGLGELFNNVAIRHPPKDGQPWGFDNISELQALLPLDTVDNSVHSVFNQLPQWGETELSAKERYLRTIQTLADNYPSENLLLITHGEGVKVAVSTFLLEKPKGKIKMDYCAYAELRRETARESNSFSHGEFVCVTQHGQNGIKYPPPPRES